jgi:hypothetical protein
LKSFITGLGLLPKPAELAEGVLQEMGYDDPADYVNLPVIEVQEIREDLTKAGMARGHVEKLIRAMAKQVGPPSQAVQGQPEQQVGEAAGGEGEQWGEQSSSPRQSSPPQPRAPRGGAMTTKAAQDRREENAKAQVTADDEAQVLEEVLQEVQVQVPAKVKEKEKAKKAKAKESQAPVIPGDSSGEDDDPVRHTGGEPDDGPRSDAQVAGLRPPSRLELAVQVLKSMVEQQGEDESIGELKACKMGVGLLGLRRGQGMDNDIVPMSHTQLQLFKKRMKSGMKEQDGHEAGELKEATPSTDALKAQLSAYMRACVIGHEAMRGGNVKPICSTATAEMLIRMSVEANKASNAPQVRSVAAAAPLCVAEMNVASLKKELSERGMSVEGKRAELQERLTVCMEDELEEEGAEEGGGEGGDEGGDGQHELEEANQVGSPDCLALTNLWEMINGAHSDQFTLTLKPSALVLCEQQEGSLCGAHAVANFSQRPLPHNVLTEASQAHKAYLVSDAGTTAEARRSLQNDASLPAVETDDFSAETLNHVRDPNPATLTTLTLTLTLTQALHPSPSCNVMQTLTPARFGIGTAAGCTV